MCIDLTLLPLFLYTHTPFNPYCLLQYQQELDILVQDVDTVMNRPYLAFVGIVWIAQIYAAYARLATWEMNMKKATTLKELMLKMLMGKYNN